MEDSTVLDKEMDGLMEAVELSQDEGTLKQTLRNFSVALGFNRFAYLNVRGDDVRALSNYHPEWQRIYLEKNYTAIDPVVVSARRSMQVFNWSQEENAGTAPETVRFFGEAAEFGIRSGLSIPVRGSFGRMAMLTLASDRPRSDFARVRDPVHAITAVAFVHIRLNHLLTSRRKNSVVELTPREAHCIAWASLGKTKAETAALLGIKEKTVRFYTESAFAKLGAVNITHAVRLAIENGLI
jgi:LuxR family transcriptional activator of conjugal transfer of Ti plasmids